MPGRKETVSDIEFLALLAETEDRFLTATEIRDAVGFDTNKGVNKRLKSLYGKGMVEFKQVGTGYTWWITPEGREHLEDQT